MGSERCSGASCSIDLSDYTARCIQRQSRKVSRISILKPRMRLYEINSGVSQATQELKTGVSQINNRMATLQLSNSKQEQETMINWISPLDFRPQHHDFIQRKEHGTGKRFLEAAPFQYWLTRSHQELFCPGIPGAGKTIMAATVVNHLEKMFEITSEKTLD